MLGAETRSPAERAGIGSLNSTKGPCDLMAGAASPFIEGRPRNSLHNDLAVAGELPPHVLSGLAVSEAEKVRVTYRREASANRVLCYLAA